MLVPFVPLMYAPFPLMLCTCKPTPPLYLEINAQLLSVSYIPTILSSIIACKKHDANCGLGVPELKSVGVACMNFLRDIISYVSIASLISLPCIPSATRKNICCGLSITFPLIFKR